MLDEARLRDGTLAPNVGALLRRVSTPMAEVERQIDTILDAGDEFLYEASVHLLKGGGKRLRPALHLLSVETCGADSSGSLAVPVAAALECVHMATLVHDDVIDGADQRRGVPTVHSKWGAHAGVLVGDYLFARAFTILSELAGRRALRIMSMVVLDMARGEMTERRRLFDLEPTLDGYLERIHQKTASFMAECCRLAAVLAEAGAEAEDALGRYGRAIGMCYQIVDDVLDFTADGDVLGKPAASDLRSGVLTLPALHVLERPEFTARFRRLLSETEWGKDDLTPLMECIGEADGIGYSRTVARRYADEAREALLVLPAGSARDTLDELAAILVERGS